MSNRPQTSPATSGGLPAWLVTGILGLAVGAAGGMIGLVTYGYALPEPDKGSPPTMTGTPMVTPGAPPAGTGGAGGMGPGGGGMMGGGGGGMMGGGMMGGGGGGGGKRTLTSLVGKLELLSRNDLPLKVELTPEQTAKVAELLGTMEQAEKMTGDEATAFQKTLEEILTKEQNDVLALVGLPFVRPAGGGGMGGAMGGGGANPDENPFTQEVNQKRLKDLLDRIKPAQ